MCSIKTNPSNFGKRPPITAFTCIAKEIAAQGSRTECHDFSSQVGVVNLMIPWTSVPEREAEDAIAFCQTQKVSQSIEGSDGFERSKGLKSLACNVAEKLMRGPRSEQ